MNAVQRDKMLEGIAGNMIGVQSAVVDLSKNQAQMQEIQVAMQLTQKSMSEAIAEQGAKIHQTKRILVGGGMEDPGKEGLVLTTVRQGEEIDELAHDLERINGERLEEKVAAALAVNTDTDKTDISGLSPETRFAITQKEKWAAIAGIAGTLAAAIGALALALMKAGGNG